MLAKGGPEAAALDVALADFLRIDSPQEMSPSLRGLTATLGAGEQQAVALATQRRALLIIDDRSGRTAARAAGVRVTGTVGVLIEAKRLGLLPAIRPVLRAMQDRGYWLSDELIDVAARLAGEAG